MRCIVIIGLLCANMVLSQDTARVHTYGGSSFEDARCIVPSSSGGYILAGTTGSQQESTTNAYVLKLDSDLNCLWNLNHGGFGVEQLSDVIEDQSGNIVAVGYASIVPDSGYDAFVLKLDADGNVLWQRNMGGTGWQFLDEVVEHPTGGYVVAGKMMSGVNASDALLYHLDSDGNLVNELILGGSFDDSFNFLAANDSVMIAGGSLGTSDTTECAWSVWFDLNLSVLSADTNFAYSSSRMEYMDFHGDTVFVLGTYFIDSLGVRGSFLSRKESANTIWSIDAYNFEAREIRYNNQLIYLPGTNSFFGLGGAAASICLLNQYGNFVDCPSFGDIGDEGFYAMSFNEGIPLLVGSSNSYSLHGDNDVYVVLLSDSMVYGDYILDIQHADCFSLGTSSQVIVRDPMIQTTSGSVLVEWGSANVIVEVYDLLGNSIMMQEGPGRVALATSGWASSIYVLKIRSGNDEVNRKIFLFGQ